MCVAYYALSLNSTDLHGDIVLNYLLGIVVETPTTVLLYFSLDGVGRRFTLAAGLFMLGSACFSLAFIHKDQEVLVLIAYLIGKGIWLYGDVKYLILIF